MLSRKAVAALLLVHVTAMLASQTEGFVPIFTYSELRRTQEREQNKRLRKSLRVQQRSKAAGRLEPQEVMEEEENGVIKLTAPVEIGVGLSSRQLEKHRAVLEALLSEALPPPSLVFGGQRPVTAAWE
uniref:Promotilin n=1 Tax=Cavia porcellus TaxID=10141 RepID=MOTI_CAVPO|nr:RecName: Full=Promotilin; Contains: RecName: Full=Motilin; Contains: RecName: Full=Motilin-associated peptide; Short=MAP; Flags: Precursor [Cavia porcellus]AAK07442.1 motilin precursor [Cavia porcellus]